MKPLFEFAGDSALGVAMRDSAYYFPLVEMVHLLGLGLLLGSVVLLNARFFGLGMKRQRVSEVAADFAPWTGLALVLMAISGIPLFASKAPDLWSEDRSGFYLKMSLILLGVILHYAVQVPLARRENFGMGRLMAAISLIVWFGAAMAGLSLEFL